MLTRRSLLSAFAAGILSILLGLQLVTSVTAAAAADSTTVQQCKTVSDESLLTIDSRPAILDKVLYDFNLGTLQSYQNQRGYLPKTKPTDKFVSMVKETASNGEIEFDNLKNPDDVKWVYTLTGIGGERTYVYLFREEKCRIRFPPLSALWMTALHPGAAAGGTA